MINDNVVIFFSPRAINALKIEQVQYRNTMTGQMAYSIGNTKEAGGALKQTQMLTEPKKWFMNFR